MSRFLPVGETSGLDFPVARGPVPRARWIAQTMARDRPSPYGEGGRFFIVVRGPVPREFSVDRSMARDRPSPYGEGGPFFAQETFLLP